MNADNLPLLHLIKSKLSYLGERQRVLSENIANAPTPGYMPRDVVPGDFAKMVRSNASVGIVRTDPHHISGTRVTSSSGSRFRIQDAPDTETTLDGNSVVLEEQMIKLSDTRMAYDQAISIYQKSLSLLRLAMRRPGA